MSMARAAITGAATTAKGPILCFGNSHTVALKQAHLVQVRKDGAAGDMVFFNLNKAPHVLKAWRDAQGPGVDPALKHVIAARLAETAPRAILLLAGGNEHNVLAMFRHPDSPEPLDLVMPGQTGGVAAGHRRLPVDLVRAELRMMMSRINLPFMAWVGSIAACPLVLVAPPPPVTDPAHLQLYPDPFAERMAMLELSPALFRHKVWLLDLQIRRDLARRMGALLVTPPHEAFDAAGLGLGAAFRQKDPTHGNALYGRMILRHIRQALGDPDPINEATR